MVGHYVLTVIKKLILMEDNINIDLQPANRENTGRNSDGTFMKGISGNPNGRPKNTLKDYVRKKFMEMSEEEKEEFLKKVSPETQWKMGEGNPDNNTDLTSKGEKIFEVINKDGTIRIHSASRPERDSKQS